MRESSLLGTSHCDAFCELSCGFEEEKPTVRPDGDLGDLMAHHEQGEEPGARQAERATVCIRGITRQTEKTQEA